MKILKKKTNELIKKTILIGTIEFVILLFFLGINSLWILWGVLAAVIGILMIKENIIIFINKGNKKRFNTFFLFRYFIYGIMLSIAAYYSSLALFLSFLGLFNLKFAVIFSYKK